MPVSVEQQRIKGPGVYDMKCGLVQIIFALRTLRDLELSPPLTPVTLINTDEEIGSRETLPAIRHVARRVRRAFVLEPSLGPTGKLKTARKGVGHFTIIVKGKAAHAGLDPEAGASAIVELSHVIQKLFALNDIQQGTTVNVGVIDGGLRPNVVAPESRAEVDVRVLAAEEGARVEAAIRTLEPTTAGTTIEVVGGINRPPMQRTAENQQLWHLARDLGRELGMDIEQGIAGGGSDGNFTSLFTATLDGLGAVGDGAHASHEHVIIDHMPGRCALLALLLLAPLPGQSRLPESGSAHLDEDC
jgi:glutamate carboxypeptidase